MAKKTATIPLAGQVLPTSTIVAATDLEGLASGRYFVKSSEVGVGHGFPGSDGRGYLDVYAEGIKFLRWYCWDGTVWSRRKTAADVWLSWVKST